MPTSAQLIEFYLFNIQTKPIRTLRDSHGMIITEFWERSYQGDMEFLFRLHALESGVLIQAIYPYRIGINHAQEYRELLQQLNRWNSCHTELRAYFLDGKSENAENRTCFLGFDYFIPVSPATLGKDFINLALEAAEKPGNFINSLGFLQKRKESDQIVLSNENAPYENKVTYQSHEGIIDALDMNILFGELVAHGDFNVNRRLENVAVPHLSIQKDESEHFLILDEIDQKKYLAIQSFLNISLNNNPAATIDQINIKNLGFCLGCNRGIATSIKLAVVSEQGKPSFIATTTIPLVRKHLSKQLFWNLLDCHLQSLEQIFVSAKSIS